MTIPLLTTIFPSVVTRYPTTDGFVMYEDVSKNQMPPNRQALYLLQPLDHHLFINRLDYFALLAFCSYHAGLFPYFSITCGLQIKMS